MPVPKEKNRNLPSEAEIIACIERLAREILNLPPGHMGTDDGLRPEAALVTTLDLDSVARLELLFAIEETYGIIIDLEDGVKLDTVGDLVHMVRKHVSESTSDGNPTT